MTNIQKIIRKISNVLEASYSGFLDRGTGLLRHIDDARDFLFVGFSQYKRIYESIDSANEWRFNQARFNICVFAAVTMIVSWQNKMRFSVRWLVKLGVREGIVSGNGFSYFRGVLKLVVKYGLIPYKLMPDEINGLSFEEYSRWTYKDEMLLKIAENYKVPAFRLVTNTTGVNEALDKKMPLLTGCKWFYSMNKPYAPDYFLIPDKRYLGGHAFALTGYDKKGYITTQSFGLNYAKDGQAWDTGLFEKGDFAIYLCDFLPESSKQHYQENYS